MPVIPIHNIGDVGVIKDIPSHLLPPEAWSDSNNVGFDDGRVMKAKGNLEVFDPPSVSPAFVIGVPESSDFYWVYTSLTEAHVYQGATHTEITRTSGSGDYNASNARDWNGAIFNGVLIINNGVDDPQFWASINPATKLDDLTNWPANHLCKVMRAYRNFLIALNITDNGTVYPYRVKWSNTADPGTIPNSWDHTDPTKDAGEYDLADVLSGAILDGLQLGDRFVIYKAESTWIMDFIGGAFIFSFKPVLDTSGILATRCVCSIKKGQVHFLHNGDDLIIFDGQQEQSVLDKRFKKTLANDMDSENYVNAFCFDKPQANEAWFAYPTSGHSQPNKALVWNYEENVCHFCSFNGIAVARGVIQEISNDTWDTISGTWDSQEESWARNIRRQLLIADETNTKLYQDNVGETFNGEVFPSYIERTGLAIIGKDRQGNPKVDFNSRKLVRRIWPKVSGGPINVQAGSQEYKDGPITWETAQVFNPNNGDQYLDFTANGRLMAIRFEELAGLPWTLDGYDIEIEVLGGH